MSKNEPYKTNKYIDEDELKWIKIPTSHEERPNKFLQNPFVPLGALATTAALVTGLINLKKGDSKKQQKMMRLRILAQGFTFSAAIIGIYVFESRKKVDLDKINNE